MLAPGVVLEAFMLVFILRHGKAEKAAPSGKDFDRDLAERGREQARWIGRRLREKAGPIMGVEGVVAPEVVLASRAVRASDTAEIVAQALGAEVDYSDALLVDEPTGPVVEMLLQLNAMHESVMLVGHNPQLERLAFDLGRPAPGAFEGLRTGELVVIDSDLGGVAPSGRIIASARLDD